MIWHKIKSSWKTKSLVTVLIWMTPFNSKIYISLQKKFGRLVSDPHSRLESLASSLEFMNSSGFNSEGKTVFEVGSGHELISPLGWYLNGAKKIISVDINERLDLGIFQGSLDIISEVDVDSAFEMYGRAIGRTEFIQKFNVISEMRSDPIDLLKVANIEYRAPENASKINLPDGSVDIHFSNTVLEHISRKALLEIFAEGKRILKPDGIFIHNIDLSDHFAHTDSSISKTNFLKYNQATWNLLAGNKFAFCNRMRVKEYREIFAKLGLTIISEKIVLDEESIMNLKNGMKINRFFKRFSVEELSAISYLVLLRK
jgi:SAM-dependent methyltransferase